MTTTITRMTVLKQARRAVGRITYWRDDCLYRWSERQTMYRTTRDKLIALKAQIEGIEGLTENEQRLAAEILAVIDDTLTRIQTAHYYEYQ